MLVLTRKPGESVILESPDIEPIKIMILDNGRLGFDAPDEVQIIREELLEDSTD
jgi:carbon storage regulator CsrA